MKGHLLTIVFGIATVGLCAELGDPDKLPPAAKKFDFKKDVQDVLELNCVSCHNSNESKGELSFTTLSEAMVGGEDFSGKAIVPGNSAESSIIHLSAHLVEELEMPPKDEGQALTKDQVGKLRAWIDAGAEWPEGLRLQDRKPKKKSAETSKEKE